MMIQLGFPVRVVGRPGLPAYDGQRMGPRHLNVSLVYLRDILVYLRQINVRFYRVAPTLLPTTCPATAWQQLDSSGAELAALAALVRRDRLRLTLHMPHTIALGSACTETVARSLTLIELQAALLEGLGMQADGVLVVHAGGPAREPATQQRFAAHYRALSPRARARVVLEHDTNGMSLGRALAVHQSCGVPVVFDYLHWQLYNPEALPLDLALGLALATWPAGVRPEVHMSSARTEAHLLPARSGHPARVLPPRPGQHADFIAVADLLCLLRAVRGLPAFDLMVEAKAGDLALLRIRSDIARVAPDLAVQLA